MLCALKALAKAVLGRRYGGAIRAPVGADRSPIRAAAGASGGPRSERRGSPICGSTWQASPNAVVALTPGQRRERASRAWRVASVWSETGGAPRKPALSSRLASFGCEKSVRARVNLC